jgi:hypothetical protein
VDKEFTFGHLIRLEKNQVRIVLITKEYLHA